MEKILFVDDVKLHREKQQAILSSSHVHVLTASNGDEALAVARQEIPSLIVMDEYLSDANCVACCREIKADPQLRHIPVIMLTNTVKSADFEEYRAAGFTEFLPKPLDGKMFFTTVKKYLPVVERRSKRVPLRTEVRLDASSAGFHVGMTRDLSSRGIYVTTELRPSPEEEFTVSFVLPGCEAPTEARAKVAWFRNSGFEGKPGFGVEFLEIIGKGIPLVRKSELESFVAMHGSMSTGFACT